MKKSLIALLLVVALVVTVSVFAVSAETNPFADQTETVRAYCQACGEEVDWTPLVSNASEFTAGHYYLTGDTYKNSGTTLDQDGEKVCLELNGFKLDRTMYTTGLVVLDNATAEFNLFDTVGTGSYVLPDANDEGTIITAPVVTVKAGTFNQYGGTLTREHNALADDGETTTYPAAGGLIVKMYGGTYNMIGGTITGGYAYNTYGTNIYVEGEGAVMNIKSGATVSDGVAARSSGTSGGSAGNIAVFTGTVNIEGTVTGGQGVHCGNIYATGDDAFVNVMPGAVISDGTATNYGGNFYLYNGAQVAVTGGTISGGSGTVGGNFYIRNTENVSIKNATITGGNATHTTDRFGGANIAVAGDSATVPAKVVLENVTISDGTAKNGGGAVWVGSFGTCEFKSGNISGCSAPVIQVNGSLNAAGTDMKSAASVAQSAKFLMSGGTISGLNQSYTGNGAAIHLQQNGYVEITNGTIEDFTTTTGYGAAYCANSATGTKTVITGGTIQRCTAKSGGAIYLNVNVDFEFGGTAVIKDCTATAGWGGAIGNTACTNLKITGGTIQDCAATATSSTSTTDGRGGAIGSSKSVSISGGEIKDCTSASSGAGGGNIYIEGGTLTISGGTISNGNATKNLGGNLCIHGASTVVNFTNGTIIGGDAVSGGNVGMMRAGAQFNMSGTAVLDATGTASATKGKNMFISAGTATINGGTVKGATTDTIRVNNSASAILNLNGGEFPYSDETNPGSWARLFTLGLPSNAAGVVNIGADFTGKLATDYWAGTGDDATAYAVGTVLTNFVLADGYNADNLLFFVYDNTSSRQPAAVNANNQLEIVGFAGIDADGIEHPVTSADADYPYIKLYGITELTLTKDLYVDFNNQCVEVTTGTHKLYPMDYRTDALAPAKDTSYFTVDTEANVVKKVTNPVNGYQYAVIGDNTNGFTANRVKVDIDSVNIKPASAALYYTTNIGTNTKVAPFAKSYGVVLSLADMPDENFVSDKNNDGECENLYTEFDLDTTEQISMTTNSALLEGILNQDAPEGQNKTWGELPIYATAFMCVEIDGVDTYFMADQSYELSLLDILKIVDETAPSHASVLKMYENWQDPMAAWAEEGHLANIKAAYDEA